MLSRRQFLHQASKAAIAAGVSRGTFSHAPSSQAFTFRSPYIKLELSAAVPAFVSLTTDSLGKGDFAPSPMLPEEQTGNSRFVSRATHRHIRYYDEETTSLKPLWEVSCREKEVTLSTHYRKSKEPPPFGMTFSQKANHCTVLGSMTPEGRLHFPCVLHLPGMGTFRIHCDAPGVTLGYDADRKTPQPFVRLSFAGATSTCSVIRYRLESVAIHPDLPRDLLHDSRYDGFRKNYLNIFQLNPRLRVLANNSASDTCAFTQYLYAEMARHTPPLANGLTAMDLVRESLERYLDGMKGYGMVGYNPPRGWLSQYNSSDSLPSLIMAACYYISDTKDHDWGGSHYAGIRQWAEQMLATDTNQDGILEYGYSGDSGSWTGAFKRPANWWDTIGFGHDDAYSNALAYRALQLLAGVAEQLGKTKDQVHFSSAASKLKAAYLDRFYNPETGLLGGWRSRDGVLHDYCFTFVNSIAVCYGLLEGGTASSVMRSLVKKMDAVGYADFGLGIPGNLLPIADEDYAHHDARWGYQHFQVYENGGATACYEYYTLRALYMTGQRETADAMLLPLLKSYRQNAFQGNCPGSPMTRDWKSWTGACWGYEGFLVDNYLALLAVLDHAGVETGWTG